MLTREEFIAAKLEKAKLAAENEWVKRFETKSATQEGVMFARWVKKQVEDYADRANKEMEERYRCCCYMRDTSNIYSTLYAFILHILRRNCEMGNQMKSIETKDIAKAREIVESIIKTCEEEQWRKPA